MFHFFVPKDASQKNGIMRVTFFAETTAGEFLYKKQGVNII